MSVSLANSDGCRVMKPNEYHEVAPLKFSPHLDLAVVDRADNRGEKAAHANKDELLLEKAGVWYLEDATGRRIDND